MEWGQMEGGGEREDRVGADGRRGQTEEGVSGDGRRGVRKEEVGGDGKWGDRRGGGEGEGKKRSAARAVERTKRNSSCRWRRRDKDTERQHWQLCEVYVSAQGAC